MRFALLGPLVVTNSAGELVTPAGWRLRVLLAALLLHANVPVPAGTLAEIVWDGSPPPAAVDTLRSYVRRLRRALGTDATRIAAHGHGYLINVRRPELDTLEFESLCREARAALRAEEWVAASAAATRALELWRATPLLDVSVESLREEFVPRFEQLRLQVLEDYFDAGLRLGQHQELIPELLDLTSQHPLQERFHAQLMLALASAGRRAQALDAYQEARRVLIRELGVEPGPQLRDIHQQVLAGDVPATGEKANRGLPGRGGVTATGAPTDAVRAGAADPSRAMTEPAGSVLPCPTQLPADIADFTGREAQVDYVCDVLTHRPTADSHGTVRVVVVAGAAGLGKSALAVHTAHQVRDFFPDGQLYANLSGASAGSAAPGEILARFLRDLGVNGDSVPAGEEERAALYRTLLTSRRVLILLDDAKDTAQVRPLLPGSALCAVVVTTRNRTPYVVSTGFVDLNTLPAPEALELFSRIVGHDNVAAEPEASAEIIAACAGLPLAIRICAARLATRRQWKISTMAARLRERRHRLDVLQVGDLEVRASFQVSYDSLYAGQHRVDPARVFRLLGLWRGQHISLPAAAALIGEPEEDLVVALEALVDANLLESPAPDRYRFHDLLRLFAAERARDEEPQTSRHAAVARLLQWYLEMATAAADVLSPYRYRLPSDDPRTHSPKVSSREEAFAWYDNERENVVVATRQAAAAELHDIAWRLPTALFPLFNRRSNWTDCVTTHRIAVVSARAAGHRQGEPWALQNLGHALAVMGDTEAFARLEEALLIRRESGDRVGEGQTLISLADACYRTRGAEAAIEYTLRSVEVLRQTANPIHLPTALNNHAEYCVVLGRLDEAAESLREALDIWAATEGDMAYGRGHAMETLGRVYLETGNLAQAVASLTESHRLHVVSGELIGQARSLKYLGLAQRAAGQEDQARESLAAALALFEKLGAKAEAEQIHVRVDDPR